MGAIDLEEVLRAPCQVCQDPTNLSAAFPHGGTALGLTSYQVVVPNFKYDHVHAHERGGARTETIFGGGDAVLGLRIRQYDADAYTLIFPQVTTGGSRLLVRSGEGTEGEYLSGRGVALLFSPVGADGGQDPPGLYAPLAVPRFDESLELRFQVLREFYVPVLFDLYPTSTVKAWNFGPLSTLSALLPVVP